MNLNSDDLFVKIHKKILERAKDKDSLVRAQIALTLCRLQDEEEEDSEVIGQLASMLQFDTNAYSFLFARPFCSQELISSQNGQ